MGLESATSQYTCNRIGAAGTCGNAQSGNLIVNPVRGLCRYSAGLLMVIIVQQSLPDGPGHRPDASLRRLLPINA